MKINYKAIFTIDLGQAVQPVGDLIKSINQSMSNFGYDEKLSIESDVLSLNVEVNRELTQVEENKVKDILKESMTDIMNKHNLRLKSFSRQSCNVEQLAS